MADPSQSITDAFNLAVAAYRAGNLAEAEKLCHRIIAAGRDLFDALHLLAVIQTSLGKNDLALASYDRALAIRASADAHNNRGATLLALQRFADALADFDRALALRPDFAEALNNRGNALKELKRLDEALAAYGRALDLRPDYADALNNRGVTLHELARFDEAAASFTRVLSARPDHAKALYNLGNTLRQLNRHDEALASYDRAVSAQPSHAGAHYNRGVTLHNLKRIEEALASYDRALSVQPANAEAHNNRGIALQELNRFDEALASFDRALSLRPDYAEAFNNRGIALQELKRFDEALADYDRALVLRPDYAEALNNRGNALRTLRRYDSALASYERAMAASPDYVEALVNRGVALGELGRHDEALASLDRALSLRPDYVEALVNRAIALRETKQFEAALACYDRALAAKTDDLHAFGGAADCVIKLCDWDRRTQFEADLPAQIFGKKSIVSPFVLLGYSDDPALKLQCAKNYVDNKFPSALRPMRASGTWRNDRIRLAYLSADFRAHPGAHLMAGLFEKHDRARFEVLGVSFGADDRSAMRQRLIAAFDEFHDVRSRSDQETAQLLCDLRVDIAIDRNGHTYDSRPGILAYRPAPIQVTYLGYPGTLGTQFIDYIVADRIVAPFEHQPFYAEKIVHLPDCYQVNSKRRIAESAPTRSQAGLPEHGFVFCCFNNDWKIAPATFDIWMRLLQRVEGSVFWLLRDNEGAERNLRMEARRRGVDPARLVFADRIPIEAHLARHRLADLFLDTLPYNAHTTASDALWVGLPVLTCKGETFAARVAASLLHAVGLPELIAAELGEYEALALELAGDPAQLAEIRTRLANHRDTHPLFDTDRSARHIEAAYTTMWETWQHGEAPKSFSVAPID